MDVSWEYDLDIEGTLHLPAYLSALMCFTEEEKVIS